MTDQARDIVERVALAMAKEIGWGTFSHFNPDDMRRVAKAAIEAAPGIEALTKRVAELEEALKRIAEGNLGSMPWQADYAKIREVASAALSNTAKGEDE
jgi:hypothetical protein